MQIKALALLLPFLLSHVMAQGKASDLLASFISDIPSEKLTGLPKTPGKIYSTEDYRLDMQGLTTERPGKPQAHNLQIQANTQSKNKQVKGMAPATVAGPVLVPVVNPWSAATIRSKLKASTKI